MKEVLYADEDKRIKMLKDDFETLSKLANPNIHKRGIPKMGMEQM